MRILRDPDPQHCCQRSVFSHLNICVPDGRLVRVLNAGLELVVERVRAGVDGDQVGEGGARLQPGLAIKNPPKKTQPKIPLKKNHCSDSNNTSNSELNLY
jgi:hypothetical protein